MFFCAIKKATDMQAASPPPIAFVVRGHLLPGYSLSVPTQAYYTTVTSGVVGKYKKENREGIISVPATILSQASGALSAVPVIGPYASAVSMA